MQVPLVLFMIILVIINPGLHEKNKPLIIENSFYSGAKTPACRQAEKDMNRNRLGDELGEPNKYFRNMLFGDEGSHAVAAALA